MNLLHFHGLSTSAKTTIVATAIRLHGAEMIEAFTVISPGMVRIRRAL